MTDKQASESPHLSPPRLYPTRRCADADAVIGWLKDVVGFTERVAYRDDKGAVQHAELAYGSSILMLGQDREDDYGRLVGERRPGTGDALYLAVADIDGLYERVQQSGVAVERPLQDTAYGSREFLCRDPDGGLWSFGTYWPTVGGA